MVNVTPKTVLGAEQLAFPCKVFCQTSAEEVLSMRRNKNWYHGIDYEHVNMLKIQNVLSFLDGVKYFNIGNIF